MLGVAYKSRRALATHPLEAGRLDKLLPMRAPSSMEGKRKGYIWEMQKQIHENGGALIPAFRDWLDAHSNKVAATRRTMDSTSTMVASPRRRAEGLAFSAQAHRPAAVAWPAHAPAGFRAHLRGHGSPAGETSPARS